MKLADIPDLAPKKRPHDPEPDYSRVDTDLKRIGKSLKNPKETRKNQVAKDIEDVCLDLLAEEIANDPENRGYAGKNKAQIAALVNEPYQRVFANVKVSGAVLPSADRRRAYDVPVTNEDGSAIDLIALKIPIGCTLDGLWSVYGYTANVLTVSMGTVPPTNGMVGVLSTGEIKTARVSVIFSGVPFGPHAIEVKDIP